MTVGNRKKLEVALGKSCAHILAGEGYKLTESKDLQRLSKSNDFVEWHFLFYLTDNAPYGIFSKSAVVYLDATNKIKNLLSETGLFSQYQVGISQSSGKHCGTLVGKKISPSEVVGSQVFCSRVNRKEERQLLTEKLTHILFSSQLLNYFHLYSEMSVCSGSPQL